MSEPHDTIRELRAELADAYSTIRAYAIPAPTGECVDDTNDFSGSATISLEAACAAVCPRCKQGGDGPTRRIDGIWVHTFPTVVACEVCGANDLRNLPSTETTHDPRLRRALNSEVESLRAALPIVRAALAWHGEPVGEVCAEEGSLFAAVNAAPPELLEMAKGKDEFQQVRTFARQQRAKTDYPFPREPHPGPDAFGTVTVPPAPTPSTAQPEPGTEPALPLCPRCGASIRGAWHCCCAEPSERSCDTCQHNDPNHDCAPWCTLHGIGVVRGECRGCRDYEAGAEPDGEEQ